jgi:hypothetical protein
MWRNLGGGGARVALLLLLYRLPAGALPGVALDAGPPAAVSPPFMLGLADKSWTLQVTLPGFHMEPTQHLQGGARARGSREPAGWAVSLTLATSPGDPSARSCRDHDWAGRQKAVAEREDTRLSEQADRARVEFVLSHGEGPREKHVLLYLERDGVCVVIHLSKHGYQSTDDATLEAILDSVRLGSRWPVTGSGVPPPECGPARWLRPGACQPGRLSRRA